MNEAGDIPPDLLARIEAYYGGDMPPEEMARFREELRDQPQLAAQVAAWEAVYRHGLRPDPADREEDERLRRHFRELEQQLPPVGAARRSLPLVWLSLAAGVLFLLLAGWFLLQSPNAEEQLAESNFAWLPRDEQRLGPGEAGQQGLSAYDQQQYARAFPLLVEGVAEGSIDSVNLIYAGVAAVGAGRPEEARTILTDLLTAEAYPLREGEIRFYLALAELKLGNPSAAVAQLDLITLERGMMANRVRRLRNELAARAEE
jgi:anti-sigma factor RsiW